MKKRLLVPKSGWSLGIALFAALAVGCGGGGGDSENVKVMTHNMYFGFDFTVALQSPETALEQMQENDAEARIAGLAKYLAFERPDFVGLQEVISLVLTKGTPETADDTVIADFETSLQDAIRQAGAPAYKIFPQVTIQVPGTFNISGAAEPYLFTVSNMILVHPEWTATEGAPLLYRTRAVLGGILPVNRGVARVTATNTNNGTTLEVFNTHLESLSTQLADAQAAELAAYVTAGTRGSANTAVLLGDLNSIPTSAAVASLKGAGLQDSYAATGVAPGYSCCQAPLLDNPVSTASDRIDYIFVKPGAQSGALTVESSRLVLTSRVNRSMTSGQIWVSDHFGVLTTLSPGGAGGVGFVNPWAA